MAKLIPVRFTIVDDEDYESLCQYDWYITPGGHVYRKEDGQPVLMHRMLMNAPDDLQVDHINGFGADNQKVNLRLCTHGENMRNRRVVNMGNKTSTYKGVTYDKTKEGKTGARWQARVRFDGREYKLGMYWDEVLAAKVYDAAARYYHGEFANTNFPGEIAMSVEQIRELRKSGELPSVL